MRTPYSRSLRESRVLIGLFLVVFGIVSLSAGGHTYSSDEETMLATTRALVHGRVSLTLTPDTESLLSVRQSAQGPVGIYGLGESIAMIPTYVTGAAIAQAFPVADRDAIERLFADFTGAWIAGLLAVVVFLLAKEFGAPRNPAFALGAIAVLGTGLWVEAKTMFSEPLTALLITTSVLFAIRAAREASTRTALLSGLAAGAAPLARSIAVLFVVPVAIYVLVIGWRSCRDRRRYLQIVAAFLLGTALTLGLFFLSNAWRFGSPFDNGYSAQPFTIPLLTGLFSLFLSPGKSLFLYAPVALAAVLALPIALRSRPAETILALAVFLVAVPIYAVFRDWAGDNAWGPRYLYTALPLLLVLIVPALSRRSWRRVLAATAITGGVINIVAVLVYFNVYIVWSGQQIGPAGIARDSKGQFIAYDDRYYEPQWSAVIGEWRLLPSAVKHSALELAGQPSGVPPFPAGAGQRYGWYFALPPQLDLWWYLAVPTALPLPLELLAGGFLFCIGAGVRLALPALQAGARKSRGRSLESPTVASRDERAAQADGAPTSSEK